MATAAGVQAAPTPPPTFGAALEDRMYGAVVELLKKSALHHLAATPVERKNLSVLNSALESLGVRADVLPDVMGVRGAVGLNAKAARAGSTHP